MAYVFIHFMLIKVHSALATIDEIVINTWYAMAVFGKADFMSLSTQKTLLKAMNCALCLVFSAFFLVIARRRLCCFLASQLDLCFLHSETP